MLVFALKIREIGIYIFPDVEELDFVGVYEVLAKTKAMKEDGSLPIEEPLHIDIISSEEIVRCANGLVVKPHKVADDFKDYDMIIVPGGRGISNLLNKEDFLRKIKQFSENHLLCSICTGAFVLAKAGVLKGKKATTHHNYRQELNKICEVINKRVVVDDNVISAGGISCSLDAGLKILEIIYGEKIASIVANRLEFPIEISSSQ